MMKNTRWARYFGMLLLLLCGMNARGQGHNGTWVPNSSGSAVYGTGATSFNQDLTMTQVGYVSLPVAVWPNGNTWSVSCRINTTSAGANPGVIFGVGNATNVNQVWFGTQGSNIKVSFSSGGANATTGSVNVLDGTWHTILVVCNAGTIKLYVDGIQDGTTLTGYVGATPTSVAIGNLPLLGTYECQGAIDEVAIFSTAISPTVQTSPWGNSTSGLLALYHLDNNLNDSYTAPASISSSPSTMLQSAVNVSLAITGVSTNFTGSPFSLAGASGTGGAPTGASIVSQTINSTTSATVVINAPSSATTFSIVDSGSGAYAALTSTTSLTTPGTPTASIGATGTGLSLTSTGSTGGSGTLTYAWYRGLSSGVVTTLLTNQTVLTISDRGLQPSTAYYYKVVVTDAASNTATSAVGGPFTTHAALSTTLKIGFIGDSIGVVLEGGTETSCQRAADTLEQLYASNARTVIVNNQCISGTTSTNWNPGGTGTGIFATALSAMVSANCTYCHIMLGTNDAKNTGGSTATPQATYKSNLAAMIASLKSNGMKVILSFSPYIDYATASSPWDSTANTSLWNYEQAIFQLVDNVETFLGDDLDWQVFSNNYMTWLDGSDISGVHPTLTGLGNLGLMHGQGIYRAVYATPTASSGVLGRGRSLN